ncbi:MAG TPA: methyltransferase domain-containing protein [Vicinamibacterales bacterium]|nr:methyltransferase domain-containing protein [Vicinamibacterales bacterium]
MSATDDTSRYALGHSNRELDRLSAQARLIDPITRQFFREAGITRGMRVLDVGSGAGDVALLLAELIGNTGEVVGVDRAPRALAVARARADLRRNVSFREGDPARITFERGFDAVVGRYVLQFQPDPVAMLRALTRHLHPGGIVAFHELDWDGARSFTSSSQTYDQCCRWIVETLRMLGAETRMGIKLHSTFVGAGLPAPSMRLEAVVGGGVNSADCLKLVTDLMETLLTDMGRLGVATAADIGIETLSDRIRREVISSNSVIVGRSEIGAWTRV